MSTLHVHAGFSRQRVVREAVWQAGNGAKGRFGRQGTVRRAVRQAGNGERGGHPDMLASPVPPPV
eukprot:285274-Chlamydomonas_euryale.AAC.1